MIIFFPETSEVFPSFSTIKVFLFLNFATPSIEVILFFLRRPATPLFKVETTSLDLEIIFSRSTFSKVERIPNSADFSTRRFVLADCKIAFVGMQPLFKQVPPKTESFSTTATLSPS